MGQATFIVRENVIRARVESDVDRERCREIMGGRAFDEGRIWEWPASPWYAGMIRKAFQGVGNVKVSKEFSALLAATAPLPTSFDGPDTTMPLWSHQSHAVQLALPHRGFYLAHDMGAGKSATAIAITLKRRHKKVLIFAPKRVVPGWAEQIKQFAGDQLLAVPLVKGTLARRIKQAQEALDSARGEAIAIIINYESLTSAAVREWMYGQRWDLVIADEAHRAKSPNGVISKALGTLSGRADYRLCLSGTPIPHNPLDVYAQFRFLDPSVYGSSFVQFKSRYAVMGGFDGKQVVAFRNLDDLHQRFYSRADRVVTADVVDLPEFRDEVVPITLSGQALSIYKQIEEEFYAEVEDGTVTIANALTKLLRLQQVTSGHVNNDNGQTVVVDHEKEDSLKDLLLDLPTDEPVVVFATFRHDLAAIQRAAVGAGRTVGEISGIADDYDRFREGEVNTLAVQIQAGGEGLNDLVRARYCIYYSVGFSLARYNQSRARVVRPGQRRNVIYYHLVAQDTIDQKVYKALAARQDVIESILRREAGGKEIQVEDEAGEPVLR